MGKRDLVSGFATEGLSRGSKNRIIIYIVVGVLILAGAGVVYFFLPKNGSMNNPYKKGETEFDMNHNDGSKDAVVTEAPDDDDNLNEKEKRDKRADSEEFSYKYDGSVTSEMEAFKDGDVLRGYARVEKCMEDHAATTATMTLYSDGKDNFLNHLDKEINTLCIDPGLEPPHDGTNKNTSNRWDGNKVGNGDGMDWWYGLTDYGYTATLETYKKDTATVYDWAVVINFGYGEYNKDAQRMKCHITYSVPLPDDAGDGEDRTE